MFKTKPPFAVVFSVMSALMLFSEANQSFAQTHMRQRGDRGDHSALSLQQMLMNLISQRHGSATVYATAGLNQGSNSESWAAGVGMRVVREEASQFNLEYIQGQTFLRAQFGGELLPFDLNFPILGSPIVQVMMQALGNNLEQGVRNIVCDSRGEVDPSAHCRNDDEFSQQMDVANNRHTTGFGLRIVPVGVAGQYLRDLATASPAGSYIILSPSVLLNLLHIDYRTLQNSGISSLAIRIGGSPVAMGAAASGNEIGIGAGGTAQIEVEMVYHLGHGHFLSLEGLYRFFGAYHDVDGNSASAINSLKASLGYSYWPSAHQGTGIGFYLRPNYELNAVNVESRAHPDGETTMNHTETLNAGFEF